MHDLALFNGLNIRRRLVGAYAAQRNRQQGRARRAQRALRKQALAQRQCPPAGSVVNAEVGQHAAAACLRARVDAYHLRRRDLAAAFYLQFCRLADADLCRVRSAQRGFKLKPAEVNHFNNAGVYAYTFAGLREALGYLPADG